MSERLHVQTFLDAGNAVEDLTATLGISVKQHPRFPELYHLSYDQLESPKAHPIVRECRGLILNSKKNWAVVAYPFHRFANQGEEWADQIDWNSVRVQEKVDGSLMILWHYNNEWNVSTKGSPDAGGPVGDFGFTFADLFWLTLKQYGLEPNRHLDFRFTYMIELTSIYNRVVCSYGKDSALTLIGVRNVFDDGYPEIPVSIINIAIPVVKEYPLTSLNDIVKAAEALDPIHNEGFVVVDKNFNRVKIKSPSYVMIHHMKDGFGQRRIIRLIQLGETSEVLSYFPEYQELFDEIRDKIDAKIAEVEADWERLKHITDRKAFALEATQCGESGTLFAMYLGKAKSVRDHILYSKKLVKTPNGPEEHFQFTEEKIERMIGLKSAPPVAIEV